MKKSVLIIVLTVVLITICFGVSIPFVNDLYAGQVADELGTLLENTRIAEKSS